MPSTKCLPQTNTLASFSSVRLSLDIACNLAQCRFVVTEIIWSPWLVTMVGRQKSYLISP